MSTVDSNTNKDGAVEWSKVAVAMGFEAGVCEEKYNKLLAEEAAGEREDVVVGAGMNKEHGIREGGALNEDDGN